jgi:hypothetical protein
MADVTLVEGNERPEERDRGPERSDEKGKGAEGGDREADPRPGGEREQRWEGGERGRAAQVFSTALFAFSQPLIPAGITNTRL